jgi:protein gp37
MGSGTGIEWTEVTWNPTTGCDRLSAGCDHCYALALAKRLKAMGQAKYQADGDPRTSGPGFGLSVHADALRLPYTWAGHRTVFVNSMSDLFHVRVPLSFVRDVFDVITATPQHTYQVLTKRAARLPKIANRLDWPPNLWLGVSVEDTPVLSRVDHLRTVPAAVRFLSCEPLIGPLDGLDLTGIDWVIAGGESGPDYRPLDPSWVTAIRDSCVDASVPFFFKLLCTNSRLSPVGDPEEQREASCDGEDQIIGMQRPLGIQGVDRGQVPAVELSVADAADERVPFRWSELQDATSWVLTVPDAGLGVGEARHLHAVAVVHAVGPFAPRDQRRAASSSSSVGRPEHECASEGKREEQGAKLAGAVPVPLWVSARPGQFANQPFQPAHGFSSSVVRMPRRSAGRKDCTPLARYGPCDEFLGVFRGQCGIAQPLEDRVIHVGIGLTFDEDSPHQSFDIHHFCGTRCPGAGEHQQFCQQVGAGSPRREALLIRRCRHHQRAASCVSRPAISGGPCVMSPTRPHRGRTGHGHPDVCLWHLPKRIASCGASGGVS